MVLIQNISRNYEMYIRVAEFDSFKQAGSGTKTARTSIEYHAYRQTV